MVETRSTGVVEQVSELPRLQTAPPLPILCHKYARLLEDRRNAFIPPPRDANNRISTSNHLVINDQAADGIAVGLTPDDYQMREDSYLLIEPSFDPQTNRLTPRLHLVDRTVDPGNQDHYYDLKDRSRSMLPNVELGKLRQILPEDLSPQIKENIDYAWSCYVVKDSDGRIKIAANKNEIASQDQTVGVVTAVRYRQAGRDCFLYFGRNYKGDPTRSENPDDCLKICQVKNLSRKIRGLPDKWEEVSSTDDKYLASLDSAFFTCNRGNIFCSQSSTATICKNTGRVEVADNASLVIGRNFKAPFAFGTTSQPNSVSLAGGHTYIGENERAIKLQGPDPAVLHLNHSNPAIEPIIQVGDNSALFIEKGGATIYPAEQGTNPKDAFVVITNEVKLNLLNNDEWRQAIFHLPSPLPDVARLKSNQEPPLGYYKIGVGNRTFILAKVTNPETGIKGLAVFELRRILLDDQPQEKLVFVGGASRSSRYFSSFYNLGNKIAVKRHSLDSLFPFIVDQNQPYRKSVDASESLTFRDSTVALGENHGKIEADDSTVEIQKHHGRLTALDTTTAYIGSTTPFSSVTTYGYSTVFLAGCNGQIHMEGRADSVHIEDRPIPANLRQKAQSALARLSEKADIYITNYQDFTKSTLFVKAGHHKVKFTHLGRDESSSTKPKNQVLIFKSEQARVSLDPVEDTEIIFTLKKPLPTIEEIRTSRKTRIDGVWRSQLSNGQYVCQIDGRTIVFCPASNQNNELANAVFELKTFNLAGKKVEKLVLIAGGRNQDLESLMSNLLVKTGIDLYPLMRNIG